jgi:hypothetical protein
MKSCRFKVDKTITVLDLNHATISFRSLASFGSPQVEDVCVRFELYTQQQDLEGNPIGQPVKCSEQIILEAVGPAAYEELQNLKLSNPILILPNVWYILFMHNAGDSAVYFVSNVSHINWIS